MILSLENVGRNQSLEYAVNPLTVTEMGAYVAPVGTMTVSEFVFAFVTTARTAPQ
jgi:hypothetical protein